VIGNGFVNGDVKSHAGAPGDTSHTEQIWIPEGLYKFTIMDTWNDGMCCMGKEMDLTSSCNSKWYVDCRRRRVWRIK